MEHIGQVMDRSGGRQRTARGRKDAQKQEKPIEIAKLDEKMPELKKLLQAQKDASVEYSDAVKAAAEASGLQAGVVRRFVAAKAGNATKERQRDAEQLALLFEESKAA